MAAREPVPEILPAVQSRTPWLMVGLLVLGFVAARLPFVLWLPGGQDEDLVSVPGLTLAREGVPRIPYMASRARTSMYNGTERAAMFYPPGGFLVQAAFFLWLPPSHATARIAGLIAAVVSIVLVFALGRKVYSVEAGLWGAGLYAASRPLMFVAVTSRPDALCAALGLGALLILVDYWTTCAAWRLIAAGVLLGLGLFTHPFAVVYCLLCGIWVLATPQPWRRRILAAALLTGVTLLTASLWLVFILQHPEEFQDQFLQNVVHRVPGSLAGRLLWAWPYLGSQLQYLREHAGLPQLALLTGGWISAAVMAVRSPDRKQRGAVLLAASSAYLLVGFLGGYQTKMYWNFVAALFCVATGGALAALVESVARRRMPLRAVLCVGLAMLCLPGAGLTMWWKLVRPDPEHRYHAPDFIAHLLQQLPAEGRFAVDTPFVLEMWLSGRDARLHEEMEIRPGQGYDYDWLLMGRNGLSKQHPQLMGGEYVQSFGDGTDPLACYAELYRVRPPGARAGDDPRPTELDPAAPTRDTP